LRFDGASDILKTMPAHHYPFLFFNLLYVPMLVFSLVLLSRAWRRHANSKDSIGLDSVVYRFLFALFWFALSVLTLV
jgi:hypothetical protein